LPVQLDDPADIRDHILKNYVGKNVLVVGHTDTVPELIGLLGDASSIAIAANEFDNLFVLTHSSSAGATSTVRFKYGNSD
jgi:hypothetical protein